MLVPMKMRLYSMLLYLVERLPPRVMCFFVSLRRQGLITKGKRSYIHPSVQILGLANVNVGSNSVISQDTWLNVNHRNESKIAIHIGNNCFIGRRNFFFW